MFRKAKIAVVVFIGFHVDLTSAGSAWLFSWIMHKYTSVCCLWFAVFQSHDDADDDDKLVMVSAGCNG